MLKLNTNDTEEKEEGSETAAVIKGFIFLGLLAFIFSKMIAGILFLIALGILIGYLKTR